MLTYASSRVKREKKVKKERKRKPQGPVVRRPISACPGLNLTPVSFSRIIFSVMSFQSSTCRQKELNLKCLFKLSNLNSNLALTLGYHNPAFNNSAQMFLLISGGHIDGAPIWRLHTKVFKGVWNVSPNTQKPWATKIWDLNKLFIY